MGEAKETVSGVTEIVTEKVTAVSEAASRTAEDPGMRKMYMSKADRVRLRLAIASNDHASMSERFVSKQCERHLAGLSQARPVISADFRIHYVASLSAAEEDLISNLNFFFSVQIHNAENANDQQTCGDED